MSKTVLVTGVNGYIASHVALQLLEKGYNVVGTMRNLSNSHKIVDALTQYTKRIDNLSFYEIDLLATVDQWQDAMKGVDFVMHIASPFPKQNPKSDDEVIKPAKQGTLSVLEAATKAGIKRVVLTSSGGASQYGVKNNGIFTEEDWTDITNLSDTSPYFRSKTIAEKSAWEYIKHTENAPELVTILPGAVLGPLLLPYESSSVQIVSKPLDNAYPAVPNLGFSCVDVRSIADLHIKAMESKDAAGHRFNGGNEHITMKGVVDILQKEFPNRKIPTRVFPDFIVRFLSLFFKELQPVLIDLGAKRIADNSKAYTMLGWQPIAISNSVKDCAYSLLEQGVVK